MLTLSTIRLTPGCAARQHSPAVRPDRTRASPFPTLQNNKSTTSGCALFTLLTTSRPKFCLHKERIWLNFSILPSSKPTQVRPMRPLEMIMCHAPRFVHHRTHHKPRPVYSLSRPGRLDDTQPLMSPFSNAICNDGPCSVGTKRDQPFKLLGTAKRDPFPFFIHDGHAIVAPVA